VGTVALNTAALAGVAKEASATGRGVTSKSVCCSTASRKLRMDAIFSVDAEPPSSDPAVGPLEEPATIDPNDIGKAAPPGGSVRRGPNAARDEDKDDARDVDNNDDERGKNEEAGVAVPIDVGDVVESAMGGRAATGEVGMDVTVDEGSEDVLDCVS
jgi:hypothetical protein